MLLGLIKFKELIKCLIYKGNYKLYVCLVAVFNFLLKFAVNRP